MSSPRTRIPESFRFSIRRAALCRGPGRCDRCRRALVPATGIEVTPVSYTHLDVYKRQELIWRIEELQATRQFAEDVPEPARQRLLASAGQAGLADTGAALEDLWRACLEGFQLPAFDLHPEELVDLQLNVAKSLLARFRDEGATAVSYTHLDVYKRQR